MARRVRVLRNVFLGQPVGFVFTLPLFVLDDSALQVERLLAQVEKSHAIRFHP